MAYNMAVNKDHVDIIKLIDAYNLIFKPEKKEYKVAFNYNIKAEAVVKASSEKEANKIILYNLKHGIDCVFDKDIIAREFNIISSNP